jgi:hypothetical protein
MMIHGIKEENGPWYVIEHRVLEQGIESHALGRSDWAEWSPSGDLLFASRSSLYRVHFNDDVLAPLSEARELIDLEHARFTARQAPPESQRWPE